MTVFTMNENAKGVNSSCGGTSSLIPNPIDPVVLRNLIEIRKLLDDASELVIKAATGPSSSSSKLTQIRQHRFRELAVTKMARAYAIDEIATSVLVMQSASALDDVAAKVRQKVHELYWICIENSSLNLSLALSTGAQKTTRAH
jgi:hypothetical protein